MVLIRVLTGTRMSKVKENSEMELTLEAVVEGITNGLEPLISSRTYNITRGSKCAGGRLEQITQFPLMRWGCRQRRLGNARRFQRARGCLLV